MKLKLGISSCPNDVFAFHALLEQKITPPDFELDIQLLDIEMLNTALAAGELDCGKASFHAFFHLQDSYELLPVGAALGRGVGPVLVARQDAPQITERSLVLCPGAWTTATLLFQIFCPEARVEHRIFSEIMPALERGEAQYGVVIHEGRFTFEEHGLKLIADLGELWEKKTGQLIPLGGLLIRSTLPDQVKQQMTSIISDSLSYALENRAETLSTMQRYAQELTPEVIWNHVDLYVNRFTQDLGAEGKRAIETLLREASVRMAACPRDPLLQRAS